MTNTTSSRSSDANDPVSRVLNQAHPGHVALACAALGWRVIPLRRDTKKPALNAWPERATTDRDEIIDWFADGGPFAGCVCGIATGRETGLFVVDVDVRHQDGANGFETLAELERQHGALPRTFTVETGSGGQHRYFRYPADREVATKAKILGRGLDTRGWHGQVVAPGTVVVTNVGPREYRVLDATEPAEAPNWLLERVTRDAGATSWSDADAWDWDGRPAGLNGSGEAPRDAAAWIRDAVEVDDGDQEWYLFRFAASCRARNFDPDEIQRLGWQVAQRFRVFDDGRPWTELDVREKVRSVLRYQPGTNGGTGAERATARPVVIPEAAEPTRVVEETVVTAPPSELPDPPADLRTVARDVELPSTGGSPDNPWRNTDRANGIEVARFLDGRAFWTPENGWFVYDGRRWAPDAELVRLLLVGEYTDQLRRRVTSGEHAGRDEGEVLMARANRIESSGGLQGALEFAKAYVATAITRLDADPWLLNCPNGTLDLRTGELLSHDPHHLITRITPTPYDATAADEVWDRVRYEALEGDEHRLRLLARFAGYTLTGRTTEKCMLVISGPTNTAKSTITEPLYRALGAVHDGGYATTWDADVVQADARVNRAEKLNKVRGARMVLVGELAKGSRMADNFVKQFTGGDTMDARGLYKDSYSYRPTAKLWMATNYVPGSADRALQERLLLLPFLHTPERKDPRLKAHLEESSDAQQAMLAWAARGCRWWLQERSLGDTPWLDAARAEYALESDPILQFAHDRLEEVVGYEASSLTDDVWQAYALGWAEDNVRHPLKRRPFEAAMKERGFKRSRGAQGRGQWRWLGVRLQENRATS